MRQLLGVVGAVVAVGAALLAGLVVTMRTRWEPGLRFVRRVNRRFTNPRALRTAGRPGASAAAIRHVGRTSGREYVTPIGVEVTKDGFLTLLPYGSGADWVRNVLAAGRAEVTVAGVTHRVGSPEVLDVARAGSALSAGERRVARVFGVTEILRLRPEAPA
ncbi:nitroreductase family deazaflavin-dependent oxidoreductase [Isoptericola aurantiacus]|uniref:nitroreductase family deazaflavin-dependent oxidoreductase n=1 Tax=Isoptericola aurantiacus TaxID=3377839 RepID=UPI00383B80F9